jgi:hypothetical protein
MAKRVTVAQAKKKRQIKILIVLAVVFAIVSATEVPKILKQLSPPAPSTPAAASAPSPSSGAASSPSGTPTASSSAPVGSTVTPSLTGGVAPTAALPGEQLHDFSHLALKDPFHPLIVVGPSAEDASLGKSATIPAATTSTASAAPKSAVSPAKTAVPPVIKITVKAPPPNAAVIKTNGKLQVIFVGDSFPTANPLFKLVGLGKKGVRIAVLGGSFAAGVPTMKLITAKEVTFANQADGSRYAVELLRLMSVTQLPTPAPGAVVTSPATPVTAPTAGAQTTALAANPPASMLTASKPTVTPAPSG